MKVKLRRWNARIRQAYYICCFFCSFSHSIELVTMIWLILVCVRWIDDIKYIGRPLKSSTVAMAKERKKNPNRCIQFNALSFCHWRSTIQRQQSPSQPTKKCRIIVNIILRERIGGSVAVQLVHKFGIVPNFIVSGIHPIHSWWWRSSIPICWYFALWIWLLIALMPSFNYGHFIFINKYTRRNERPKGETK